MPDPNRNLSIRKPDPVVLLDGSGTPAGLSPTMPVAPVMIALNFMLCPIEVLA